MFRAASESMDGRVFKGSLRKFEKNYALSPKKCVRTSLHHFQLHQLQAADFVTVASGVFEF